MSNLGLHALYSLLNGHDDVVAERVFWQGERPLSLESGRPLADFAVLAFSISYELDYFHVAAMLRASGLPLWSTDRDQGHPLLIAGGPAITANPMPLAPFFDCLCIGEAEPILPGLLAVLSGAIGGKRSELRRRLTSLPGVYVPLAPPQAPVARRWAEDLDDFPVTSVMLTPDTELGDLYLIEVERGCTWNCRFCLVSTAFKPMRFRSVEKLMEQAERGLKYRKRLGSSIIPILRLYSLDCARWGLSSRSARCASVIFPMRQWRRSPQAAREPSPLPLRPAPSVCAR
jgi:hypothetical protein